MWWIVGAIAYASIGLGVSVACAAKDSGPDVAIFWGALWPVFIIAVTVARVLG